LIPFKTGVRIYYEEDGSKTYGTVIAVDYGPPWAKRDLADPILSIEWDDEKDRFDPYSKEEFQEFHIAKDSENEI